MRRSLCVAVWFASVLACTTVDATQVVIVLRPEGIEATGPLRLAVLIRRPEGDVVPDLPMPEYASPLPAELDPVTVIPRDGDADRTFEFSATLTDDAGTVVALAAPSTIEFVADTRRVVVVSLRPVCVGMPDGTECGPCQACRAEACVPVEDGTSCGECQACQMGTCSVVPDGTECGTCQVCGSGACGRAADGASCGPCTDDTCASGRCQVGAPAGRVIAGGSFGFPAPGPVPAHTCAVRGTSVSCWGTNNYGILNRAGISVDPVPTEVPGLGLRGPLLYAAGARTSFVGVDLSGRVVAWGSNTHGALGRGTEGGANTPDIVDLGAGAVSFLSGGGHYCTVVGADLSCWGYNAREQIMAPASQAVSTPTRLPALAGRWIGVTATGLHTCAIVDPGSTGYGELWCWGYNGSGELGDGTLNTRGTPMRVGDASDWSDVAAGEYHTCGTRADGSLWCWGGGGSGALGVGTTMGNVLSPVQVPPPRGADGSERTWSSVEAGPQTTCAIDSLGDLHCWGRANAGGLGNGVPTPTLEPNPILVPRPIPDARWTSVTVGPAHTCGILNDGSLWCWGANSFGELGIATMSSSEPTPMRVCLP